MTENLSVLDPCRGSRMFWFDKKNPNVLFGDKRRESHILKDKSNRKSERSLVIDPDFISDFTALPFPSESFFMVVFDPPHLLKNGKSGWLAKKYGQLQFNWEQELSEAFEECFRVLKFGGTLIFKWNETDIPVSKILSLTSNQPLIGNRCGKQSKSHWIVFMKGSI